MSKGYSGLFHGTLGTTIKNGLSSQPYSDRGIEIPEHVKQTLSKLKKTGATVTGKAGSFPIKDVSIMSKEAGVEFARVTIGNEEILIRGDKNGATIPYRLLSRMKKEGGVFDFHSHPYDNDNSPSADDYAVMRRIHSATGQVTSKIVTPNGRITVYSSNGVIETGIVSNVIDNDMKEIYKKLFGGK